MKFKLLILALLVALALSESRVVLGCGWCSSIKVGIQCLTVRGGGFNYKWELPLNIKKGETCKDFDNLFPGIYDFNCTKLCYSGCLLTMTVLKGRAVLCSKSKTALAVTKLLDMTYSALEKDDWDYESKYDWCGCKNRLLSVAPLNEREADIEGNEEVEEDGREGAITVLEKAMDESIKKARRR